MAQYFKAMSPMAGQNKKFRPAHAKGKAEVLYEVGKLTTASELLAAKGYDITVFKTLQDAVKHAKQYQDVADGAKAHIKAAIGPAAVGLIPGMDGAGYTRKLVMRKAYQCEASTYIDFRFSKKPKVTK